MTVPIEKRLARVGASCAETMEAIADGTIHRPARAGRALRPSGGSQ
ncbi:hypothetical protein [Nonomuraea recticatena]